MCDLFNILLMTFKSTIFCFASKITARSIFSIAQAQVCHFTFLSPLHTCKCPCCTVPPVGVDRTPVQDGDGGIWDWFTPAGRPNGEDATTEVTYPKRLVQQIRSEEEMAHGFLDTRVKNDTGDTLVS